MADRLKQVREPFDVPAPAPGGIAARARAGAAAPRYLEGLNPEQREAVETLEGPVLVLAGAGTGKTRVLTTRIAHILNLGRARPAEILAVTFTNKAAREMKDRVGQMIGQVVEGMPWLDTFHAIGVKILRRHAELVGLRSDFTILDTDDQIRLIKQLLEFEKLDEQRWPARVFAALLEGWKNRGLAPDQVPAIEAVSFANGKGKALYQAYQQRLKTLNAADFGDLLLECIRLFRQHPDILRQYQERFKFILVDEYQDTNTAQYLWLKLLAQPRSSPDAPGAATAGDEGAERGRSPDVGPRLHTNICCVGDDDQSIYGWRGADVDNILRFEHDFPGARIIRLETNYRSTGHIVAAAAHLIAHNRGRLGKTLRAEGGLGEKVRVTACWDSEDEARAIGEEIESMQRAARENGADHPLDEIAILVRASFQMREFEDRFIQIGLPFRVIGGPRFYERAEIRDALAYLRVIAQPADDLAFERILNVPKRGLGDAALQMLNEVARRKRIPLLEAARLLGASDEMKPKPRAALRALVDCFDRWRGLGAKIPHAKLAEIVLDESGYTEMWQRDRSADAAGRLENLKELIRSMEEFENLTGFLEHIALVTDADGGEGGEAVNIMTLHAAKGLEFDTVFLPGWEDGLFPHQRSLDEEGHAGLEEERRLAHVGLTRARKRARIYFATNRRIHGLWTSTIPSRFLDELPPDNVEVTEARTGGFGMAAYGASRFDEMTAFGSNYGTPGWRRAQGRRGAGADEASAAEARVEAAERGRRPASRLVSRPGQAGDAGRGGHPLRARRAPPLIEGALIAKSTGTVSQFAVGERVFHQKFGNGNVIAVDGNKLTVAFDKAGEKRVVDRFLERV